MRRPAHSRRVAPVLVLVVGIALLATGSACKAHAQHRDARLEDVAIRIVDGTGGEPTEIERITLALLGPRQEPVLDVRPQGSSFVLEDVPLRERSRYVIAAWKDGVPYFFDRRGDQLRDEEQVLHVFAATTDVRDVRIRGMNLVLRRQETLVELEMMLQVENLARPQTTFKGVPASLHLELPAEAERVAAEFHRGVDPVAVPVSDVGGGRWGLDMGIVPGNNRMRVTAVVPWREGLEMKVGSDLAVDAWSLLATPDWLEIDNRELEPDPDAGEGMKRMVGPALDPGRVFRFILRGGEIVAGPTEDLFTGEAPAAEEPAAEEGGTRFPYLAIILAGLLIVVIVARRRNR